MYENSAVAHNVINDCRLLLSARPLTEALESEAWGCLGSAGRRLLLRVAGRPPELARRTWLELSAPERADLRRVAGRIVEWVELCHVRGLAG